MIKKDIIHYYADENVVRIIAGLVLIIATLALVLHSQILFLLLSFDFALRAFTYQPAPLAAIAKLIARSLQLSPYPIFAAPKRFAAGLGFAFSFLIFILFSFDLHLAAYVAGGLLLTCALLEAAFRICVGCYLFSWVVAPIMRRFNKQ